MTSDEKDVKELVELMKATAREHAAIPVSPAPRDCYHNFVNGLKLCLTVDILTAAWLNQVGQVLGAKSTEGVVDGAKFWHLSIARTGAVAPMDEEVAFWRRAFFEEPPFIETGGMVPRVHSRHFFWKYA